MPTDISVATPTDAAGRHFVGVGYRLPAGTPDPEDDDYAFQHILLVDANGNALVTSAGVIGQGAAAHDAIAAGNPVLTGGYASAAAPTSVSADGDAVRAWSLRNGARAVVLTAAGALIGGDAANGIDVDVTRASTDTLVGAVTETAPATDTASSGLNGRLQRIAQRLTSIIALLPTALGSGGGLKVDGSGTALPVDTEMPAAAALADTTSNPTAPLIGAANEVYNGSSWDRARSGVVAYGSMGTTGIQVVNAALSSGSAFFPQLSAAGLGDATSVHAFPAAGGFVYNGSSWDRFRSGAVANVAAATGFANALGVGQYNATAPTLTDTRYNALQLDVSGQLKAAVGGMVTLTSTPTLSVAGSYATGDYIGPTTTPASFTSVVRISGGSAEIRSLVVIDKTVAAAPVALELWLFSATFTAPTDNAAWAITDAESLTSLGVIPITTDRWFASSNNRVWSDDNVGKIVTPAATTLFYALVARGTTPTWVSGDIQVSIGVVQQ